MRNLTTPVDARLVVLFRRLFGLAGLHPAFVLLFMDGHQPSPLNFPYEWFPVTQPSHGVLTGVHIAMAAGALGLALNRLPRFSALLFFLTYTYVFLLERAFYNNHYYLICLLAFLFAWLPAGRAIPLWHLWLLRAQIVIVYFYGGLAKIQHDWLMGNPLRIWFPDPPWAGLLLSYGGLLFDLFIPVLLLNKSTRVAGVVLSTIFHMSNQNLFSIGIFPLLMVCTNLLFLDPKAASEEPVPTRRWDLPLLATYLAIQLLVPFRHHLYPGNVDWTHEGHYFSWRMKLLDRTAHCEFHVRDPQTGREWQVLPQAELSRRQVRKLSYQPEMLMRYARHLEERFRADHGVADPEVRVLTKVSLNQRPSAPLLDPEVDVTRLQRAPILNPPEVLPALPHLQRIFTWLGVLVSVVWLRCTRAPVAHILRCTGAVLYYSFGHPIWFWLAVAAGVYALARSRNPYELYWLVWLRLLWVVSRPEA